MKKRGAESDVVARQKNTFIPRLILIVSILLIVTAVSFIVYSVVNRRIHNSDSVPALYDMWEAKNYQRVYEISGNILEKSPLHNTARAFRGYSAFMLAVSQSEDISLSQSYLDDAVNNLRVALQNARPSSLAELEYALGRTYFMKNRTSSYHYYADLAVKYLEMAQEGGYSAKDISELLGLSYASLGETEKSIAAFTEALLVRESDTLLFDIAKQYFANSQGSAAKQYLYRVISTTQDEERLLASHSLLGKIYIDEGNYADAKKEFEVILEKNEFNADAYYGLGVIYEKQGDMARARSQWRKCLSLQVNHPDAMKKLGDGR